MAWREVRQQARGYDARNANYMDMGHETLLDTAVIGSDTSAAYRVLGRHSKTTALARTPQSFASSRKAGCCPPSPCLRGPTPSSRLSVRSCSSPAVMTASSLLVPFGPNFHKKVLCCFSQIRELITQQTIIFDIFRQELQDQGQH